MTNQPTLCICRPGTADTRCPSLVCRNARPAPVIIEPPVLTATIETTIKILVKLKPGAWIMGEWAVVQIQFEVFRDEKTGLWFSHVNYGNFRAVRRPNNYRGKHNTNMGPWAKSPVYPGFQPHFEHIPLRVLDIVRATYEEYGVSPEILPPPDVTKGKGKAR